jgi:fatty acid kinase fatty acid binding subunit
MPRRVALVTDSTADLPPRLIAENEISVVPLTVNVGGTDYLDGVEIRTAEFYGKLTASREAATTSQPSPGRFAETYERLLADHEGILSLHISSDMSGTVASATQAAQMVAPERIKVVDTRFVSVALGLITLAAARVLDTGASADEAWERVRPLSEEMKVYVVVGTLEYLRRGGRIGRARSLLGSMLQIKPVITVSDGQVAPLEQVRTARKAVDRVIELTRATGDRLCAAVVYGAAPGTSERIAESIEDRCESLLLTPMGPVVGAHAGPELAGVCCYPAELFPLGLGKFTWDGAS